MNRRDQIVVCVLATFLLSVTSQAVTADNPYHTILDRNPFGLNPPIVSSNAPTESPPINVKFNGIADVGGRRKAFFTIPGKGPKDPPRYVTLAETERSDVLEVTKIFKNEGEVEVINTGVKMVLNFKNNGNIVPTAPQIASAVGAQMAASPSPSSVVYSSPSAYQSSATPVSTQVGGAPSAIGASTPASLVQGVVFNSAAASAVVAANTIRHDSHPTPSFSVADQEALMRLNHESLNYNFQTGRRDTVTYSATAPKNPAVYSPSPSNGPRRMVIDPPPPLPGQ